MLDQLIQAASQQLAPQLEQAGVPSSQLSGIFSQAQSALTDGIKTEASNGNFGGLLDLFNGNGGSLQNNSIVQSISNQFIGNITSKLGLSPSLANTISGMVIPFIMNKFSGNDTGSASDASDLMSKLGIDSDDMISGALKGFLGGNSKGAGDLLGGISKLF
ncbi:MAG: hypothetical protein U0U66_01820 [Cytophagaceae bacterium]